MRDLDGNNALDGITMDINVTTDNTTKFNRHNNSSNIVPKKYGTYLSTVFGNTELY